MAAKIVALTKAYLSNEPQAEVVTLLHEMWERAKRGEISGIAMAWVEGDNSVCTNWESGRAGSSDLVSAVCRLQHRVLSADDDG